MAELKRCPFCGGEAKMVHVMYTDVWYVHCSECLADIGSRSQAWDTSRGKLFFESSEEAAEAWNRRISDG